MVRGLAAIVGLCLLGSSAHAQNAEGARLFEEGRALAADHKYVEACAKFEKSLELDPAPGTKLNFGDCHEHLGHLAQAYRLFMEVAEADRTANADRAKYAKGRADALVPKLGTLVVKIPDPDAVTSVTIGGRIVPTASEIEEKVDPGDITVEVKLASGAPFKQMAAAKAGTSVTVDVITGGTTGEIVVPPSGEPSDAAERRHSRLLIAFAAGGVGVAAMATAGVLGLVAKGKYQDQFDNMNCIDVSPKPRCNPEGYDAQTSAVRMADVGTYFFVGGAVLVAAGAVLYLTAPQGSGDLAVSPTASPSGAGLTLVGTF